MALWSNTDADGSKPKNLTTAEKALTFFVDAQEAQTTANKAKGITGAGWWRYRTYTDAQSVTRHKAELLVAMSIDAATSGDAEDTVAVDLAITISAHPQNVPGSPGGAATLSVTATINAALPLSYQWQKQEAGMGAWVNVTGANSTSYAIAVLSNDDNTDKYRVVISAGGVTATSNAAQVTVA